MYHMEPNPICNIVQKGTTAVLRKFAGDNYTQDTETLERKEDLVLINKRCIRPPAKLLSRYN